ncbi:hypothetical protein [Massilia scottii]|uniref:hypothetical protein n=1 Tax=Massilia scottii TaxID=3057166 RepID=UPI002796B002|nr:MULTISPECIES: hypothetical protein [unclassified Massilia]MDQ1815005.1 hypothetical protein [Massilia sp. CCM 9210]MDQ1830132.1 hypothetical protein [Massilia sp. CCM 9029]
MTNNEQQDRPSGEPAQPQAGLSVSGNARRRFTRAGVGVSGVLMTLASQPGMAATTCASPSGSLSNGLQSSHRPDNPLTCGGNSPGFYANNPAGWPSTPASTRHFKDIFPVNAGQAALGELALVDVLKTNGKKNGGNSGKGPFKSEDLDPHNVASHVVAAYLNIQTKRSTVLTETQLRNIWREYQTTGGGKLGYYAPTAGIKWYGDDIVAYLKTTFHQ